MLNVFHHVVAHGSDVIDDVPVNENSRNDGFEPLKKGPDRLLE